MSTRGSNTFIEFGVVKIRTSVSGEAHEYGKYNTQIGAWCGEDKNEGVKDSHGCVKSHHERMSERHMC